MKLEAVHSCVVDQSINNPRADMSTHDDDGKEETHSGEISTRFL